LSLPFFFVTVNVVNLKFQVQAGNLALRNPLKLSPVMILAYRMHQITFEIIYSICGNYKYVKENITATLVKVIFFENDLHLWRSLLYLR